MPDPHTDEIPTQHLQMAGTRAAAIRDRTFPVAVRGYDRHAVDEFVLEMAQLVGELEGLQSRESVIQRALDQVGEETAGILQRAHETADEIASRSRAQAEGRIQRADREAELTRRDADAYAEQVIVDTRLLWEQRQRLIEDIRQLADEVLATADDAMERVTLPEPLVDTEETPADTPTAEVELDVLPGGAGAPAYDPGLEGPEPGLEGPLPPPDDPGLEPPLEDLESPGAEPEPPTRGADTAASPAHDPTAPGMGPQTPAGGAPPRGLHPPESGGEPSVRDERRHAPGPG
jgi:DivIVA domain-containing protein